METDGRFFQKIHHRGRRLGTAEPRIFGTPDPSRQFAHQLETLRLAAAQGLARLAQRQVSQTRLA